jgi:hypothetical protein
MLKLNIKRMFLRRNKRTKSRLKKKPRKWKRE